MNMKTNRIPNSFQPSALALVAATVAALTIATTARAQLKPANDGSIAASPKVRQMLDEKSSAPAASVLKGPIMTCSKCLDIFRSEVNHQAKGAELLAGTATKTVIRHSCDGCETTITTAGTGKGRHSVAVHNCTAEVPNTLACCASR
jgi:hypothetical protein